jgi:very-short-patch-repair endonuclease
VVPAWDIRVTLSPCGRGCRANEVSEAGEGEMPKYRVNKFKRNQARTLRHTLTDAELRLWQILRSRQLANIKLRRQVPIGPWIVDFVCFQQMLVVEADGSQHAENRRDQARAADLQERGFRTLRFWNNDILWNTSGVLQQIIEAIEQSPSPRGLRPRPSPTRGEG